MILNSERKTKKLLEIAKDPYSKQRVNGRLDISNVDLRYEDFDRQSFYGVDFNNVCFKGVIIPINDFIFFFHFDPFCLISKYKVHQAHLFLAPHNLGYSIGLSYQM